MSLNLKIIKYCQLKTSLTGVDDIIPDNSVRPDYLNGSVQK